MWAVFERRNFLPVTLIGGVGRVVVGNRLSGGPFISADYAKLCTHNTCLLVIRARFSKVSAVLAVIPPIGSKQTLYGERPNETPDPRIQRL